MLNPTARLLGLARAVAANSRRCRADVALFAPAARRARVVTFGAPAARPSAPPRGLPPRFALCASRRADHKGVDVLLFAWSRLAAEGLRIPLVLCGTDHSRGKLTRLARRLGVADLVRDLGVLEHGALQAVMRRAEFLVLPSREEGFGLAAVEALAAGTPVLASRVGGIPEVVRSGREGLLVPPKDPAALARAARRLWEDRRLRARLSAGARRRAPRFSWKAACAAYARLAGIRPGARVAVVAWQDGRDQTGRAILHNALAGFAALGYRPSGIFEGGSLARQVARRPEAWLVFVLRYRTVGRLARFCAARSLRPVVALC
ncbi:MAG: glycosyltransferase [Elusimicrobia bacterium]|nr:glycosyltransferase [Elusimicrobiota bacterium]